MGGVDIAQAQALQTATVQEDRRDSSIMAIPYICDTIDIMLRRTS
jgi:hypothetical protein